MLEEMSIAELRERIEYNKRLVEQETEKKRQDNMIKKEEAAKELDETTQKIIEARQQRRAANDAKRIARAQAEEELKQKKAAIREKQLIEAYERIKKKKKDKKDEDDRLAKELKEIELQRQYMNANAAMVEEKAWHELERGAERDLRNNQNQKLIEQCKLNGISVKD